MSRKPQSIHTLLCTTFEAYLDKTKGYRPTTDLTYENMHMPISVSVGKTMVNQPTHICKRDPKYRNL